MAKAYYSTVFEQPAAEVWKIVRDFNDYPVWVGGAATSEIEDGKSGDTIGAVRSVLYQGRHIRQRLLAQSDIERSQSYEFCDAPSLPVAGFQATLRITPIVDGDRAFVEWWATFDCEASRRDELTGTLRGLVRQMARIAAWDAGRRAGVPDREGYQSFARHFRVIFMFYLAYRAIRAEFMPHAGCCIHGAHLA